MFFDCVFIYCSNILIVTITFHTIMFTFAIYKYTRSHTKQTAIRFVFTLALYNIFIEIEMLLNFEL